MQTRQDLHRRHVREREALESQAAALQQRVAALQAADRSTRLTDVAGLSALAEASRLKAEVAQLRESLEAAQASLVHQQQGPRLQQLVLQVAELKVCSRVAAARCACRIHAEPCP
jgi:hypothetical protein